MTGQRLVLLEPSKVADELRVAEVARPLFQLAQWLYMAVVLRLKPVK